MAVSTYEVKSGDTLWAICKNYSSSIAGSTTQAKVNTLVKLNKLPNPDLIYPGQKLVFSGSASSSSSSSSTTATKAVVSGPNIRASDATGRAVFATWTWNREHTKGYKWRWSQYLNSVWVPTDGSVDIPEDTPKDRRSEYCYATFDADESAIKVRFQVLPVSDTYKQGNNDVEYFTDAEWSTLKEYDFSNNSPLIPGAPSIEIKDNVITATLENIDAAKLNAKWVRFNLVKDNKTSLETSPRVQINTTAKHVSYQFTVKYGSQYKVRARTISPKEKISGWSEFSNSVETRPSAPSKINTYRRNKRSDGSISAYLEWTSVPNAETYTIEYTTVREDFDTAPDNLKKVQTEDARTSIEITGIESGHDYFFRVRAVNDAGTSDPSPIVTIPIGEPPAAPTTWSSTNSAFEGDAMELSWTHNARDGSKQSYAQLSLKINDDSWVTYTFENTTNDTDSETTDVQTFTYGECISHMGELHVKLDTTNSILKNSKIQWKVRTAGVTDAFGDTDWSVDRTIYIYERPVLELSVTNDLAGDNIIETLTNFPFYVRGEVNLESYEYQRPIGYHLRVVANDSYETVDDSGRTKLINPGDAVYSKYFDTTDVLIVEMSANNLDLETGMTYTVHCAADMSTGLSAENSHEFTVEWVDVEYAIEANIEVNTMSYTASISPYCEDSSGNLVENVTLSVYRREYDGSLTEIATNIPNNGTSVTDPHPALDYARYRLVVKDVNTGAISFYDMAGHRVGCSSVIIQWDEEWTTFDIAEENSVETPEWTGSLLVLPYNISVSDNRKREVALVNYAGREYPVSYYGTQIGETSSWSMEIPKRDMETIYALRRLSLWAGNVYVREPSGMGFWANVVPKFNIDYNSVIVPVTLDITRVEGGV